MNKLNTHPPDILLKQQVSLSILKGRQSVSQSMKYAERFAIKVHSEGNRFVSYNHFVHTLEHIRGLTFTRMLIEYCLIRFPIGVCKFNKTFSFCVVKINMRFILKL